MLTEQHTHESPGEPDKTSLQHQAYALRLEVERLRRDVYGLSSPDNQAHLFEELVKAESELAYAERNLASFIEREKDSGLVLAIDQANDEATMMGAATTGLQVRIHLRMAQVPTAIYHLLDPMENPLLTCTVQNHSYETRRLRVTSSIEGYSAVSIHSTEVEESGEYEFSLAPTLFPEKIGQVSELTRATLAVLVEDLDSGKVEAHTTFPVWLLARTTAPLGVRDPRTGSYQDLTQFLGAFVTPNAPCLMSFLRQAASSHPQKRLVGYQGNPSMVEPQTRALFQALKENGKITYVNSVIAFNPDQGSSNQRVRLPRESLGDKQANCLDGTVLFASLLEGISLSPALVFVPGHAFVAWETWKESNEWVYLETTLIGSSSYEEARAQGEAHAARYQALAEATGSPSSFRLLPLRKLRAEKNVTPME